MNTSIIIPLAGPGHGSRWNDQELRFCLRSIVKHLSGYGDIFLIGHKPDWVQNVIHVPATDGEKTYEKEQNIFNKIMIACKDERVSEEFLFMNDDHFLLYPHGAAFFPYYYDNTSVEEQLSISDYKQTLQNTVDYFKSIGWEKVIYYDVHCPIVYNKQDFIKLSELDWSKKFGYCIKSLYCLLKYGIHESKMWRHPDLKIRDPFPADQIREMISGRYWFSIGGKACTPEMLTVLKELYPTKSPYEK